MLVIQQTILSVLLALAGCAGDGAAAVGQAILTISPGGTLCDLCAPQPGSLQAYR
jgi:hypothetical protein